MKILATVRGCPIQLLDDGSVSFGPVGLTVDADGSPHAYAPKGKAGLDYLANAGYPGNWWGIATDKNGTPFLQTEGDAAPGFYVSTTSYQHRKIMKRDPRRYLDAEVENFIVIPEFLRGRVKPIVLGCKAEVIEVKTGKVVSGIVGDFGPATHLGEASIAVAKELGLNADPKRGGTDAARFVYKFYPGVKVQGYELQSA